MTNVERFSALLNGQRVDRVPVIEWASWWDQTIDRWRGEGLPAGLAGMDINDYFGLDRLKQFWLPIKTPDCPEPSYFGGPIMETAEDYRRLREKYLYKEETLERIDRDIGSFARAHADEDIAYWFSLDGFFWYPRTLFGIEGHLYAFYDEPDLMLEINRDLLEYHKKCLKIVYSHIRPVFMTLGEDMSYNLGPMISREQYNTFMLPFYKELIPLITKEGTKAFIDTDGQVEPLIPWFREGGIQGILPLERMAGVDLNRIRQNYPELLMIGGFDKTVMHRGEAAIRKEFERLLPVIRSGYYIPGVDHQTPPQVSLENYRLFLRLLREYAETV